MGMLARSEWAAFHCAYSEWPYIVKLGHPVMTDLIGRRSHYQSYLELSLNDTAITMSNVSWSHDQGSRFSHKLLNCKYNGK